jgi:hypothetical protein
MINLPVASFACTILSSERVPHIKKPIVRRKILSWVPDGCLTARLTVGRNINFDFHFVEGGGQMSNREKG